MPLAMETARGPAVAEREAAVVVATLEISIATAGATTDRSPRIATPFETAGDPGNCCAN